MSASAVVLQARLGSVRLPGKVLTRIAGATILEHCIRRLESSGLPVIVATTTRPEDDAIVRATHDLGAACFRGDADDVLSRFVGAGREFNLTFVVRATADNPFVDGYAVGRSLRALVEAKDGPLDHVIEYGLPVGTAVEAVTMDALERANALATDPYDREHVTSFIRRDARFRTLGAMPPALLRNSELRLTVDTPEDLQRTRTLAAALAAEGLDMHAPLAAIIRVAAIFGVARFAHQ